MMPSAASGALNFSNNSGNFWRWFLGTSGEMRFDSADGVSKMYLTETGKLGLGAAPTTKLDIPLDNSSTAINTNNAIQAYNENATTGNITALALSQISGGVAGAAVAGVHTDRTGGTRTSELGLYYYDQAISSVPIEGARLDASGNLGIGTTSPQVPLQVDGVYATPSTGAINGTAHIVGSNVGLNIGTQSTPSVHSWIQSRHATVSTAMYDLSLQPLGGNVGIGTQSPGAKLHTSGGDMLLDNTYSIQWKDSGGTARDIVTVDSADNTTLRHPAGSGGDVYLGSASLFTLKSATGNVGIGTATPGELLDVDGDARITNLGLNALAFSSYNLYSNNNTAGLGGALFEGSSNAVIIDDVNNYTGFGNADFTTYNGAQLTQLGTAAGHSAVFDGGNVGIGTTSPSNIFHVYENNANTDSSAGVLIEQDGTGDTQLTWRLTGTKEYTAGIDNSDGDKWKLTESGNEIIVANAGTGDLEFGNDASTGDYIFNHQGPTWALSYQNANTEYARLELDAGAAQFSIKADSSQQAHLRLSSFSGGGGNVVNGIDIYGAGTTNSPEISAYGTDSNIDLVLKPKGTGRIELSTTDSGTSTELQRLYWNSSSPADNDALTQTIYGETDLGNPHQYGEQRWTFTDVTDGTEDSTYQLYLSSAGTLHQQLKLDANGGGTELNHDGPNIATGLLVHSKNSTDTDETEGMLIEHHRGGAVGGAGLGARYSIGLENSTGSVHAAGGMGIRWTDATDTSEDSEFFVKLYEAGAETEALSVDSSGNMTTAGTMTTGGSGTGQSTIAAGLVVNDDGGGAATDDFRAETNNEANALVVDASADQVNLGVVLKLPYLGAAPGTLENGMIWMESDGLHIYYAGTERVVAGV
jgi:hypothetical protein